MHRSSPAAQTTAECQRLADAHRATAFAETYRCDIAILSARHRALDDLVDTFPALLFALATGFGTPRKRERCLQAVVRGRTLKFAASTLGLPFWMRRLPASAFSAPLSTFPLDADFNKRIAALLPDDPSAARIWLKGVAYAADACDPHFALWAATWLGRQPLRPTETAEFQHLIRMTAWAWHCAQPATPGHALADRLWSPQISLRRANDEVAVWYQRIMLATLLDAERGDPWLQAGDALGYTFAPLDDATAFFQESAAMSNCLDQYAAKFARKFARIFAIRKEGRSVANIEVGLDYQDARMPQIHQLRGPRNRSVPAEVWQAAYQWLGSQALKPRSIASTRLSPDKVRAASSLFWQPYVAHLTAAGCEKAFVSHLGLSLPRRRWKPRTARQPLPASAQAALVRPDPSKSPEPDSTLTLRRIDGR